MHLRRIRTRPYSHPRFHTIRAVGEPSNRPFTVQPAPHFKPGSHTTDHATTQSQSSDTIRSYEIRIIGHEQSDPVFCRQLPSP